MHDDRMDAFFTFVGVSVMVTKFVDFIEYIGGCTWQKKACSQAIT